MDSIDKAKILGIDVFSAVFAASCVAPGIAIIDQGKQETTSIFFLLSFMYYRIFSGHRKGCWSEQKTIP